MNQPQRDRIVDAIKDPKLRKLVKEHAECLHPCVWLVKDRNGPLEAGGKPALPAGRSWPRVGEKLLVYLLSIDTTQLPDWSPIARDAGQLLLFVAHNMCEWVVTEPGAATTETEPPLEPYSPGMPKAGDVLDVKRFRLEEGLHAGMPASWSPLDEDPLEFDFNLADSLRDLNQALKPEKAFGRLFGFHEWWTDADPARITRYSYLQANGHPYGWYQDLDGSVDKLQRKLDEAKSQPPLADEKMPAVSESVVRAGEALAAAVQGRIAERSGLNDPEVRKKITAARTAMSKRQKRWQAEKAGDGDTASEALWELLSKASEIERDLDRIPISDDPQAIKAQAAAVEAKETEAKLQWTQRAMQKMQEEARIRKQYAQDPAAMAAALDALKQSTESPRTAYRELLALLTPLQYAVRQSDTTVIRNAWTAYDAKLSECASELNASQLATALHWHRGCFQNLLGWLRQAYVDPEELAGKIDAIQWWQADVPKHQAEIAHWRPLLVMDSDGGPHVWGDAGWAIILADERKVARAELGRLAIALDVS